VSDDGLGLVRVTGRLMVAVAGVVLMLAFFNLRSRLCYQGPDYSILFWMAAYAGIVGLGLLLFRRWAAILLAVTWGGVGIASIVGASVGVLRGGSLFALVAAIGYGVPLCWIPFLILRKWKLLRW
jgi:hypothetical protein